MVIKATSTDRACYCSIACLEKSGVTLPEPLRTWHLEVEAAQNQ